MGVFMGDDIEVNNESLSFQLLNDKLLNLTHSHWDQVNGARYFFDDQQAIHEATELILKKYFNRRFLKAYLGKASLLDTPQNWGWKDPRNTIILPLWTKVFPNAKIIFIYRNGVDSAASLVHRENKQNYDITIPAYSSRCRSMQGAFDLWRDYNSFFLHIKKQLASENLLEIKYEDFLKSPNTILEQLSSFLQKPLSFQLQEKFLSEIKSNRAFSFIGDTELEGFYKQVKNDAIMIQFGYKNLIDD